LKENIVWPVDPNSQSALPDFLTDAVRRAAHTFPARTGLGWDKLHPRVVCRRGDDAILALIRIFILCELLGDWPSAIGVVIICLLPKPDGGRRPIGLLPSVIRWWMRARLQVAQQWQAANERPYFYAGPRKGAEVAAWKQAARAELASCSSMTSHVNAMLDMVKAFERVPHQWLARQSGRYDYPMRILRLSIATYRLARCVCIDGVCSALLFASRGITAGAGHATGELRLLLIEWLDDTVRIHRHIVVTVFVDDTSFEASGPESRVADTVVGAVRTFTEALIAVGMEFSPTKNAVMASTGELAYRVQGRLNGLKLKVVSNSKSLGGAVSNGRWRNATILKKRLRDFRLRKPQFQKLRRMIGARRTAVVLRTGGTAALVYGQCNTGVSTSMLYAQRTAVAAASVPGGCGSLDLTLILADGSTKGRADPAFAAHEAPIVKWAEAVWESWLPKPALGKLVTTALGKLEGRPSPWSLAKGPAAAFVATAWRLGWKVHAFNSVQTDLEQDLDFSRDPPAMVQRLVRQSVWRWRWRRVETQLPCLVQGLGGHGAFVQPLFKLFNCSDRADWGAREKGALRSAFSNRQWPQARLYQAGFVTSPNCRLCILAGVCDESTTDPRFTGHLVHRILTCPATTRYRNSTAPRWILDMVRERANTDGTLALSPAERDLLTRGIAQTPAPRVDPPPVDEVFEWVVQPDPTAVQVEAYVDGSRLDGQHDLYGFCARHGWAIAAYDKDHRLVAAAQGRPPQWADGIHGAELWALLMAVGAFDPGCALKVDCAAVHLGSRKDEQWATAPCRVLARAWGPLTAALAGDRDRVTWMPAHCNADSLEGKRLSNGQPLQPYDVVGNAQVDEWAKSAARRDAVPREQCRMVREEANRVRDAATWIGQATVYANRCPVSTLQSSRPGDGHQFARDTDSVARLCNRGRKRKVAINSESVEGSGPSAGPGEGPGNGSNPHPTRGGRRRLRKNGSTMVTPTAAAEYARKARSAKRARMAETARSDAMVLAWLASRPLGRAPAAPSGPERFAALRARVLAVQAEAEARG
jgi:hypothetical protein